MSRMPLGSRSSRDPAQQADRDRRRAARSLMPGMDGSVVLSTLRTFAPDLPVVIQTGYSAEATAQRLAQWRVLGVSRNPIGPISCSRASARCFSEPGALLQESSKSCVTTDVFSAFEGIRLAQEAFHLLAGLGTHAPYDERCTLDPSWRRTSLRLDQLACEYGICHGEREHGNAVQTLTSHDIADARSLSTI